MKTLVIFVVLLILAGAAIYWIATAEMRAFENAKNDGSPEAMVKFLWTFPSQKYRDKAHEVLKSYADREYQQAEAGKSPAGWDRLLKQTWLSEVYDQQQREAIETKYRNARIEYAIETRNIKEMKEFIHGARDPMWDSALEARLKENLRQALLDSIMKTQSVTSYLDYIRECPDENRAQINDRMEPALFQYAMQSKTEEECKIYLNEFRQGLHRNEVIRHLESLIYDAAEKKNTTESYLSYLTRYPSGAYAGKAVEKLEPLLYEKARQEDWYSSFQDYLQRYPSGRNAPLARQRLAWLKSQRAEFAIDYPKEVQVSASPYSNVSNPFWGWVTKFKETGGKIGYRISGAGYLQDTRGRKWAYAFNTINRGNVTVPAGGTASEDYWISDPDPSIYNGFAIFTWEGEDAGGHRITLAEKVRISKAVPTQEK